MSDLTTFMTDFIAWVRALLVSAVWHASIHLSKFREVPCSISRSRKESSSRLRTILSLIWRVR